MRQGRSLAHSQGQLVSVSIRVDPNGLESLLEALAQVSFPINPQIYHDAAVVYRYADDREETEAATLVEIIAEDRPGLLYDLAHAISAAGCNIEVVMIDTEAHKALDVFYVTSNGVLYSINGNW